MGRPRVKVIDTAIDLDKMEKAEDKVLEVSLEADKKIERQAKALRESTKKKDKKASTRSKNYQDQIATIDKTKEHPISEAIDIIKKVSSTKFDASIEVHVNLNTDPTKSDQLIRKSINLPHSIGKKLRVLIFGGDSKELKSIGVEIGTESTLTKIEGGKVDVDKVVATPEWMPKLTKVAKILGPKGLMPNPKTGTVTTEPEKIAKDLQSGMIDLKTERAAVIHTTIGKVSTSNENLEENLKKLVEEIRKSKPESLKKQLIKSVFITSTMSPSVKIDLSSL